MATFRVRDIVSDCLGKAGSLSLKKDAFGVYGNNNQTRSLKAQLASTRTSAMRGSTARPASPGIARTC